MAGNGDEVSKQLRMLRSEQARKIGDAARRRVLAEHTYAQRARQLEEILAITPGDKASHLTPLTRGN